MSIYGGKIPVIHTEIQPIIHQEIQPVIIKEVQPIIHKYIQPVIFEEGHPNVEAEIQRLKTANSKLHFQIQPYIKREERHTTQKIVKPVYQREEKNISTEIEYVPYIQNKYGEIYLYNKKETINDSSIISEKIIAINFISTGHNINLPMACKKTDIFLTIEKKLFDEYPELKSKKLFYIANGNVINKYISLEQNKIKNGNSILINESNE